MFDAIQCAPIVEWQANGAPLFVSTEFDYTPDDCPPQAGAFHASPSVVFYAVFELGNPRPLYRSRTNFPNSPVKN